MSETRACARGCTMYRRHLDECEGVADETCRGCLPARAQVGLLCGTCFRRFELMLTDAPVVYRWLSGNLEAGQGQACDDMKVAGGGDSAPIPIKAAVFDIRQLLADRLAAWVDDWAEDQSLTKPDRSTVAADSAFLLRWINSLVWCGWVGDWWEELAETMRDAHALAPWRPAMKRLGSIPCPECEETNLVIFGGDEDTSCLSCKAIIPADRYALWEQIVKGEAGIEATG